MSSTSLTEDGQYLILAHKASSKLSVWNVAAQSIDHTLDCQLPGPMLCRGDRIFVANLGQGTLSVFSQENWQLVNEIQTPSASELVISAPQAEYFDGRIFLTSFVDRYSSKLYVIDTKADRYEELSDLGSSSGMTVGYSGKVCLDQDQQGGSPSGAFQAKGTFDAIAKGRSVQDFGRNGESNPLIYQVRDSEFWFGANRLYRGLPPNQVGDDRGRILIPDRSFDLMYTIEPQQLIANSLTANMAEIGRTKISFPKSYQRIQAKPNNYPNRGEVDRQHAAVTLGQQLYLFIYAEETGNVYHERLKAFESSAPTNQAMAATPSIAQDSQPTNQLPSQVGLNQEVTANLLPAGGKGEFTLIQGPKEIQISADGKLAWSPIAKDLGEQRIKIRSVVDGKTDFIRLSTFVVASRANEQNIAMPTVLPDAVAGEFSRLPISMATSSIAITEDAEHLMLAHFASDKVTVWNIREQRVETTVECPSPGPMISRRTMTYVGNHGLGTISMIDHGSWKVSKTVDVGEKMINSMSAPQGRYFTGAILVTSHIDRNNGKYTVVDTRRNRSHVWHPIRDDAVATVSYNGKFVITQAGGGSASGSVDVHSTFASIASGRSTQSMPKKSWDRMPLIRQVRDNEFWFGSKWLFRGMPPTRTGEEQREIIVGDRSQDVFYRIEPELIVAVALDGEGSELGRKKTAFPPAFERMQPNNRKHNSGIDAIDRDHIAVTIDGLLHLFLLPAEQGNVYYQQLSAFQSVSSNSRSTTRRASGAPRNPKELSVGESRNWKDRTGKFTIQATLLKVESGNVTLKRTDGKEVTLPASQLSEADRAYLLENSDSWK
ncbi:MAG: SHD1 domain-containing protein [Pirellulaceae bacterium]